MLEAYFRSEYLLYCASKRVAFYQAFDLTFNVLLSSFSLSWSSVHLTLLFPSATNGMPFNANNNYDVYRAEYKP